MLYNPKFHYGTRRDYLLYENPMMTMMQNTS